MILQNSIISFLFQTFITIKQDVLFKIDTILIDLNFTLKKLIHKKSNPTYI